MYCSLDDGSLVPSQKTFEDSSFDQVRRTFKGTLRWGDNTWWNTVKAEWTIEFSEDWKTFSGSKKTTGIKGGDYW